MENHLLCHVTTIVLKGLGMRLWKYPVIPSEAAVVLSTLEQDQDSHSGKSATAFASE